MSWKFWEKSGPSPLPGKLRLLIQTERGANEEGTAKLRLIEERGTYAGRSVNYFRVFDPEVAARAHVAPRQYRDVGSDLVLHSGHFERDGSIVLNLHP